MLHDIVHGQMNKIKVAAECPLWVNSGHRHLFMSAKGQKRTLFDHLVRPGDQSVGQVEAKRSCSFEIDGQFQVSWLHDR